MPEITIKTNVDSGANVSPQGPVMDSMVASYFSDNPRNLSTTDIGMVNTIGDYLSSLSEDEFEKATILRDIRRNLRAPDISSNKLEQVYKYIKLKRAMSQTTAEMEDLEQ